LYGGNYQAYVEQKSIELAAKQQQLQDAEKAIAKAERSVQGSREKHEQRASKGQKLRDAGKIDKLTANAARGRSERSQHRLSLQKDKLLAEAESNLQTAKSQLEVLETIKVLLPSTEVPAGKMVLAIEDLHFAYEDQAKLISHFNLLVKGPERIAISGQNGAGKSTLVKLILGQLQPNSGVIDLKVKTHYLDQQVGILNPELSVLDNFLLLNPESSTQDAYAKLARFLFRNHSALKLAKQLSGGERLRAGLACLLQSPNPPQLLILDEPTNHLDLSSISCIESALQCYQGALLIISHDSYFLQNVNIEKTIAAPFVAE
jgi:ATPase subunit of ABC transporter with duplicated ATPase domains